MRRCAIQAFVVFMATAVLAQPAPPKGDRFQPGTKLGLFDAELSGTTLTITLKVEYFFVAGFSTELPGFSDQEYVWTTKAQDEFKKAFEENVKSTWSDKYELRPKTGSGAVRVQVEVLEVNQGAHWKLEVRHYPKDAPDTDASVCGPAQHHAPGGCQFNTAGAGDSGTVLLASTHKRPLHVLNPEIGRQQIWFTAGTTSTDFDYDRHWVKLLSRPTWFAEARAYAGIDEVEIASRTGKSPIELARDRVKAVRNSLVDAACKSTNDLVTCQADVSDRIRTMVYGAYGDPGFTERNLVDVQIFDSKPIDTLAHEAGHMLGLGDEAANESHEIGAPLLSPDYAAEILSRVGSRILRHNDEGIMSRGNTVRPWHYATFLEALQKVSLSHADWIVYAPPRSGLVDLESVRRPPETASPSPSPRSSCLDGRAGGS